MKAHPQIPQHLKVFCEGLSQRLETLPGNEARVTHVKEAFPELLANQSLFSAILKNVVDGAGYPDIREATMFDNEFLLYADEKRLFSIRMYLWEPGKFTPVHDHSAWGLMGSVSGELHVTKYRRKDDGSREDCARLVAEQELTLSPGQSDAVFPLNAGIHKTGNPTEATTVTVHLYGNPIRRLYINRFDLATGRIDRMYSPRTRKRILARDALRQF
jgi:predicted metal-dependent enzyme (double-stranded beta helix superfamily)